MLNSIEIARKKTLLLNIIHLFRAYTQIKPYLSCMFFIKTVHEAV